MLELTTYALKGGLNSCCKIHIACCVRMYFVGHKVRMTENPGKYVRDELDLMLMC
jgi:hypothetical protein